MSRCVFVVSLGPSNMRQDHAFDELVRVARPDNVLACVFREELQEHEEKLRTVPEYLLVRDSLKEIGGRRRLPFLRDLFSAGAEMVRGKDDWIVVLNSDIIIRPHLIEQLQETAARFVTLRRTDITRPGETFGQLLPNGIDGVAMRRDLWCMEGRFDLPDYVLGEPGWGEGMRIWGAKQAGWVELSGGETLHVVHDGAWRASHLEDPAKRHNRRLYRLAKAQAEWRMQ